MFDDPNKQLTELEDRLLAEEEVPQSGELDDQEFQALYDEILAEFSSQDDEPPFRNFANGYGRQPAQAPKAPAAQPVPVPEPAPAPQAPRQKGNGGLILTVTLEILAIAAVLAFWVLSLVR